MTSTENLLMKHVRESLNSSNKDITKINLNFIQRDMTHQTQGCDKPFEHRHLLPVHRLTSVKVEKLSFDVCFMLLGIR